MYPVFVSNLKNGRRLYEKKNKTDKFKCWAKFTSADGKIKNELSLLTFFSTNFFLFFQISLSLGIMMSCLFYSIHVSIYVCTACCQRSFVLFSKHATHPSALFVTLKLFFFLIFFVDWWIKKLNLKITLCRKAFVWFSAFGIIGSQHTRQRFVVIDQLWSITFAYYWLLIAMIVSILIGLIGC